MARDRRARALDRGQGLVELMLVLPVLLTLTFGILELGTLLDVSHSITGLTREGANMASRGAHLDSVLNVTAYNGAAIGLQSGGGVVASEVVMQGAVPIVIDQVATQGYTGLSRLGLLGGPATPLAGQGLTDGKTYFVVEVFAPYQPFTPLDALVRAVVPDTLYDRTVF
ncbi:MAG: pilus assembly protein [Gemmatimonadota bacterium]|nr:pilus assembly protein [Gemmatimonadota bacterium]